ncbi:MAG: N-acetylmuramoyl-L-alanine amidase [Bacteroidota bacterium]
MTSPFNIRINETLRDSEGKCTQVPLQSSIRTVVIDAGHGGKDPGCLGGHSQEKHIVLGIAQRFAARLKAAFPELEVILTRDDDVFIPLYERAAIANRAKADLFISIHANFMPGSQATKGSETYVMGLHTADHNLNVAKRENSAILLEADYEANYDYDPNSDEGHILMAMVQSAYLDQSILFAEQVERQLEAVGRKSRGVKQAGFVVLKETAMPSVLVESGFLSNRSEENYLLSIAGQEEVAGALLEAFKGYKQLVDGGEAAVANLDKTATPLVRSVEAGLTRGPKPDANSNRNGRRAAVEATPATYQFREVSNRGNARVSPPSAAPPAAPSPPEPEKLAEPVQAAYLPSQEERLHAREITPRNTNSRSVHVPAAPATTPNTNAPTRATDMTTETELLATHSQPNSITYDYCLQLAASATAIPNADSKWASLGWPVSRVQENGMYKYQLRGLGTAESTLNMQRRVKEAGFNQAFVVIYRNGAKLSPHETRSLLSE